MECKRLSPVLWQISHLEPELRVFGSVSYTDMGTGFNTYLLDTGDGFASFGSMPLRYGEAWMEAIRSIAGERLNRAVLFGTEEDSAAAERLLEAYPEITVFAGTNTLFQLREKRFRTVELRNDRTLSLGNQEIRFRVIQEQFSVPPIYAVCKTSGILLTADAFGSRCAVSGLLSELPDKKSYWNGVAKYYDDIFGSKRRNTLTDAVKLVIDSRVTLICPSCGPAVDAGLDQLLALYTSPLSKKDGLTVAVVYTAGEFLSQLASAMAAGLKESGKIQVEVYDLAAVNRETVLQGLSQADACLFGTSEVLGDAAKSIWDILTSLTKTDWSGKFAAVFTTSRSGETASLNLRERLTQLNCDVSLGSFTGVPGKQGLDNASAFGYSVGCYLQKKPNDRRPTLVKCLVCGEVFDASLGICPVCGVGLDQCVPVEQDESQFRKDSQRRYLILGGGVAAVSAAEAIRLRDHTGSITMLSGENYLPINRPMLTKNLETLARNPDAIRIHDESWYTQREITLHLGVKAVSIDPAEKTVSADDGKSYGYDKLIYATGAECFVPPFPGHDKDGVITIRHLWDSKTLQGKIDAGARRAVVIGGGVLGLEAASELMRAGLQVTVLEAAPQIVGRQIDVGSAGILKTGMENLGVACYEGVSIAGITGEEKANGVCLADGRQFPADFVIVSCGNRGNVGPAKDAGITVERAIVVNENMETSVPDIYACGDCAQFEGVNFQLWQEASSQGKTAGANAAGERVSFSNQPMGLSLEGFGTSLFAMGDPGKNPSISYKTVETTDGVTGRHEKYWFFGGRLEGAVVIGAPEKTGDVSQAVSTHARYKDLF